MPHKLFFRLADTVGDGSGTKQALGDYSSDPTAFRVRAQPGEHLVIERMILELVCADFDDSGLYGTGPKLTNGIVLYVTDNDGTILYYLTDEDYPVSTNAEWAHQCFDFEIFDNRLPTGDEYAAARWTFAKTGKPVELLPGWSLNVLCQDDLRTVTTGLTEHGFNMHGWYIAPGLRGATDVGHA